MIRTEESTIPLKVVICDEIAVGFLPGHGETDRAGRDGYQSPTPDLSSLVTLNMSLLPTVRPRGLYADCDQQISASSVKPTGLLIGRCIFPPVPCLVRGVSTVSLESTAASHVEVILKPFPRCHSLWQPVQHRENVDSPCRIGLRPSRRTL
jgi:hypothetical protein